MSSRKALTSILAFSGTVATSLWACAPATWAGSLSPADGRGEYAPIQSISYEFGSKAMSRYFVKQGSACLVTLMVIEKSNPDQLLPMTAARIRLAMSPGQIAGLDSEEGRSLNFTCGEGAAKLIVDSGDRDKLMALQAQWAPKRLADEQP
jgi:hypothetical protein